jgi:protein-S-isoprenylcysteine O-methyltransferase Ste14
MKKLQPEEIAKKIAAQGGIIIFFVMAFEVMIMISPFAFFFYSVFNPVFKWLNQYAATRWLTDFFLPHMILPPTVFLKTVRIFGSAFFIIGLVTFTVCALQVYLGKIFRRGIADKDLYRYIRHPQYLALGMWGMGMSVLWPRFIVLVTLSMMFILYYFLAKDEERRMLKQYGDGYRNYMNNTGMFLPQFVESHFYSVGRAIPKNFMRFAIIPLSITIVFIGTGFMLRAVTMHALPFASKNNITVVPIIPEDSVLSEKVLSGIERFHDDGRMGCLKDGKDYLGYVMPADYIMQGMIADTGGDSHLFKHHHTVAMITDWVLHPFEHLKRPPSVHMAQMHNADPAMARRHHCPIGINDPSMECDHCPYRRVILVEVSHSGTEHVSGSALLGINANRIPIGFLDINTETGEIMNMTLVGKATAWRDVPTPSI